VWAAGLLTAASRRVIFLAFSFGLYDGLLGFLASHCYNLLLFVTNLQINEPPLVASSWQTKKI
jgi:hypothetical protein